MRNYYIFKSGRLSRKDNSLMFHCTEEGEERKIPIPVNDIDSMYLFGEIDLNIKLINFLSQNQVMAHFFNYYGYYTGSFYPREFLNSGDMIVKQVKCYLDPEERQIIAGEFVKGAAYGMMKNLKRYKDKAASVIEKIETLIDSIDKQESISSLMGVEGNIREQYYKAFPMIINQDIEFEKRVKHPPDNMMNALISFMNSLVYSEILKVIYKTQLNPTISYLHEPSDRRFSLALDVAEIFKPIYADRIIFALLNDNMLSKKHFDKDMNYAYLNEEGRRIVLQEFDEKMKVTIHHKQLKKKVSYSTIMRLELYKLIKHLLGEKKYKSFRIWW